MRNDQFAASKIGDWWAWVTEATKGGMSGRDR
jgi:hypothetical protein